MESCPVPGGLVPYIRAKGTHFISLLIGVTRDLHFLLLNVIEFILTLMYVYPVGP